VGVCQPVSMEKRKKGKKKRIGNGFQEGEHGQSRKEESGRANKFLPVCFQNWEKNTLHRVNTQESKRGGMGGEAARGDYSSMRLKEKGTDERV